METIGSLFPQIEIKGLKKGVVGDCPDCRRDLGQTRGWGLTRDKICFTEGRLGATSFETLRGKERWRKSPLLATGDS